jgi:hypothetical protein
MKLCNVVGGYQSVSEEHVASFFRVEMCRMRNHLGDISMRQRGAQIHRKKRGVKSLVWANGNSEQEKNSFQEERNIFLAGRKWKCEKWQDDLFRDLCGWE